MNTQPKVEDDVWDHREMFALQVDLPVVAAPKVPSHFGDQGSCKVAQWREGVLEVIC